MRPLGNLTKSDISATVSNTYTIESNDYNQQAVNQVRVSAPNLADFKIQRFAAEESLVPDIK